MSIPLLSITSGWTALLGPFTLRVDGVAVSLTGYVVQPVVTDPWGVPVTLTGSSAVLNQITHPGQVTYTPAVTDFVYRYGYGLDRRQPYRLRWKVTDGAGKIVYFPNGDADEIGVYRA